MSIDGKHAYRFGYLKSESWSNVRLEALARQGGKCEICDEESISNDAHHVWYPENIYETTERHLVILCRPCHEFCHSMLPECKTKDEESGLEQWLKFKNSIIVWRRAKIGIFHTDKGLPAPNAKDLRSAYEALREKTKKLEQEVTLYRSKMGLIEPPAPKPEDDVAAQWKAIQSVLHDWRKKMLNLEGTRELKQISC